MIINGIEVPNIIYNNIHEKFHEDIFLPYPKKYNFVYDEWEQYVNENLYKANIDYYELEYSTKIAIKEYLTKLYKFV